MTPPTMLPQQSRDGRISPEGVRAVRLAVTAGGQVRRADVLAVITELIDLRRRVAREAADGATVVELPGREATS